MKYLVVLSKSFDPRDPDVRVDTTKPNDENEGLGKIVNGKVQQPPEPAFKRLHILYLLHDLLVYVHHHRSNHGFPSDLTERLYSDVSVLAELAVCGCEGSAARTCPMILDLSSLWERSHLFPSTQISQLRERIQQADGSTWHFTLSKLAKEEETKADLARQHQDSTTKWILPAQHGVIDDPTAPWHELPAANGLYLRRKHGYPLRASALPQGGFNLPHGGSEADPDLKRDVLNLYTEVFRCYDKYTNPDEVQDVDALGNVIWKDPERPTRNYWGFTLDGIERKRELASKFEESATGYETRVNDAVARARALAGGQGRGGMGGGRGCMGRGGWRGGRGW